MLGFRMANRSKSAVTNGVQAEKRYTSPQFRHPTSLVMLLLWQCYMVSSQTSIALGDKICSFNA